MTTYHVYTCDRYLNGSRPLIVTSVESGDSKAWLAEWLLLTDMPEAGSDLMRASILPKPGCPIPSDILTHEAFEQQMFEMAYNTFDIKVSEVNRDLHMALFFSRDRVTFKLSDNPNSILVRHVLFCKQAQVECIEKYLNYCSSPELTDLLEKLLVARRKVSLGERKG